MNDISGLIIIMQHEIGYRRLSWSDILDHMMTNLDAFSIHSFKSNLGRLYSLIKPYLAQSVTLPGVGIVIIYVKYFVYLNKCI